MNEKISVKRKIKCAALNVLTYGSAAVVCLLLAGIIGCILYKGLPHITIGLLTSRPSLLNGTAGILPNILNTLYIIIITLVIVLPIGAGAAVYLNEYAKNKKAVRLIELAAETLAGIPSVIYGLAGMLVFVRFCGIGKSILAGSLTLVIMTLPTVIRTTQESLKTVPDSYREGALALGAGTGCILSIGRIVGESAALLFTAGMASEVLNIFQAISPGNAGSTLTVALYMYAKERGDFDTAFAISAILLGLTLLINLAAKLSAKMLKRN